MRSCLADESSEAVVNALPQPDALPPRELERSESLADQAHSAIREYIATGRLAPGQRITERFLAHLLGVSPTPVREAIRALQHEGLLERRGPRDVVVVEHSPDTLRELAYIEVILRAAQARVAAAKIDDDTIEKLSDTVDQLAAEFETNSAAEQLKIAKRFDALLAAAADNYALERLISTVSVFSNSRSPSAGKTTREQSLESMRREPNADVHRSRLRDHRAIVDALRSRDPEEVELAVRRHLISVMAYLFEQTELSR